MKRNISLLILAALVLILVGERDQVTAQGGELQSPASPADPAATRGPASRSPYLQIPDHLRSLRPIVPPPPREGALAAHPLETEIYDVVSRRIQRIPNTVEREAGAAELTLLQPGFAGLLPGIDSEPGDMRAESIIGSDDRTQVFATSSFPWRSVVFLAVNFPSGSGGCTGAIIDAFHILTAGHCVHDGTSWANSVQVFPGRSGLSTPFGFAWATWYRSYTGWTVDQNHEHDWAVVTLDRNIGNFTGWMGRITMGCGFPWLFGFGCDSRYGGVWNNAGYPDLAPDGTAGGARMFFDSKTGQKANDNNHWYFMDTRDGNSGGPVWWLESGNRYIGTVHAYGNDGSGANHGTRLNNDKYDRINSWLGADAPAPPIDRPDYIDDGLAFFYASYASPVVRGETLMSVGSDVRNVGTANPGGFSVRYVLSSNTIISTADFAICEAFVASVASFNWNNSDCSGIVPASVPPGLYWVGVIYDVYGARAEFDEGNNTAIRSTLVDVRARHILNVSHAGSGSGLVTSGPGGINCGPDCSEGYLNGTVVTLSAAPGFGSRFTGWAGACSGLGACVLTMDAAKSVTAIFEVLRPLSVKIDGSGSVTSAPAGINCPGDCTEDFTTGTGVTLTAVPAPGWLFEAFTGDCKSKLPTCTLALVAPAAVTAIFKPSADLSLTKIDTPDPVRVGRLLTYTITVSNNGPGNSGGIKVTDTLNASLTYVSSSVSQGAVTTSVMASGATKLTWAVGALANGASAKLVITVRPTVAGTIKNTATVSAGQTLDPVPGNNKQTAKTVINP